MSKTKKRLALITLAICCIAFSQIVINAQNQSNEKKESNLTKSMNILKEKYIIFEEKNGGLHLIIYFNNEKIEFYPSTGKWIFRKSTKNGRGIFNLLKNLK